MESTQNAVESEKPQRKKRLSRKEQKARKRQRKRQEQQARKDPPPQQQQQQQQVNHLSNYTPIDIPESTHHSPTKATMSLGKWFPKAQVIKSSVSYSNDTTNSSTRACLLLFYQYVNPPWSQSKVEQLLEYLQTIAATRKTLGGRIRVAPEGLNATVSSVDCDSISAETALHYFCQDLRNFDAIFQQTDFKFIKEQPADRHFKDLKLLPVKELVFYGIREEEAPLDNGGTHLSPTAFHELLSEEKDTVVVDVRNHYEAAIGRFDGGSARYIDPQMRKSTDYPAWLNKPETRKQLKNKKVLMFCTGGVRCERASAYLNTKMGSDVKGVYQLQGGIERYLQEFPNGGHWRGKNFVFDKREAISADNRQGDGGVVVRRRQTSKNNVETQCCLCEKPWDRYIGKKKCQMCGVPVLVCDSCLSNKAMLESSVLRCPLCVEQDITVPADDLEYTKNGVAVCSDVVAGQSSKAAPSVLKWGGGHATKKKQSRKMKRKLCRFGSECVRKDCFFAHPERDGEKKQAAI